MSTIVIPAANNTAEVTVSVQEITPQAASEMLERNYRNNRSINARRVETYAADMKAGKWTFTGEPIVFDVDGDLVNGQHRLTAIIKSGIAIASLIVEGVEDQAVTNMDQNMPRTLRNVLEFLSYDNPSELARTLSAASVYEHYMDDKIGDNRGTIVSVPNRRDHGRIPYSRYSNARKSNMDMLDLLQRRPTLIQSVAAMKPHCHRRQTQNVVAPVGMAALMHNIATTIDDGAYVIEYIEHVRSGEGTVSDPHWQINQILVREKMAESSSKMMPYTKDALWFRGYKAYLDGSTAKLRAPKGRSFPIIPGDVEWYAAGQ